VKKLVIVLLFLYLISLFGCTAPDVPTQPPELPRPTETRVITVRSYPLRIGSAKIFYDWFKRVCDKDPPQVPANMVLYNTASSLARTSDFELPIYATTTNFYYWYDLAYVFAGRLYCYHNGAKNQFPEDDPPLESYEPASISPDMTDMSKIPSKGKPQVITRNGFHYLYKADGSIEAIEWHVNTIRFRFVFRHFESGCAPYTIIPNLLSMDDKVAFAAMDELTVLLSGRLFEEFPHSKEAFSYLMESMDSDWRREKRPKYMITWENAEDLADCFVYNFEFLNEDFTHYRYEIKPAFFDGSLEFIHGENGFADDVASGCKPISISDKMTDMLHIPDAEERYVITRNGVDYFYNDAGDLETVQWEHDWKNGLITCRLNIDTFHDSYMTECGLNGIDDIIRLMGNGPSTVLFQLFSVSDAVAAEATDQISFRLKVRDLYTPQEPNA